APALAFYSSYSFFFQAEDGIRGFHVTGVQTCALPICLRDRAVRATRPAVPPTIGRDRREMQRPLVLSASPPPLRDVFRCDAIGEIGRASCREGVDEPVAVGELNENTAAGRRPGISRLQ